MDLLENRDDLGSHLRYDVHGSSLGYAVVELLIESSGSDIEGGTAEVHLLGMGNKLLGAECGIALSVLKKMLDNGALLVLTVNKIGVGALVGSRLEATL